jgi:predicted component of type VI protein secretion system
MAVSPALFEVVAGKGAGMSILVESELVIGREADGAGRLAEDDEISRSHARVTLDASGFCAIEDLGSTNGTFVNGLRLSGPQALFEGDTIELGATTLAVRGVPSPPAQEGIEPTGQEAVEPEPPQATVIPGGAEAVPAAPEVQQAPPDVPLAFGELAAPAEDRPSAVAPVSLSLRLQVDYSAREVTVTLEDGDEPLRLVFDGEAWRPAVSG